MPSAAFDVNIKLTNMFSVEFKIPLLQATDHATAGDKALVNHI